eukprot:1189422-Rhodomonas_salina.1
MQRRVHEAGGVVLCQPCACLKRCLDSGPVLRPIDLNDALKRSSVSNDLHAMSVSLMCADTISRSAHSPPAS